MKYLKMLGLAAVAAMALTAFLGAGTASATVLCKTNVTVHCPTGWHYPTGTKIHATLVGGTATLKTGATVLDTCKGSTLLGHTKNTGSTTETIKIEGTSLTWSECTRHTTTLAQPTLEIHHLTNDPSGHSGSLTVAKAEVTVATIFGSCIYGYGAEAKEIGRIIENNTFQVTSEVPKISGPCPNTTAKWEATYKITEPTPLFISEGKVGDPS